MLGGDFGPLKARVSCQDGKSLRRVENGRYDFQIITFQDLKNAPAMAAIAPADVSFAKEILFLFDFISICATKGDTLQQEYSTPYDTWVRV